MKSVPIRNVLQVVRPEYAFLRLKPNNSIRNQATHKIARAIATLYKNILENVKREEEKLIKVLGREFLLGTRYSVTAPAKVSYYVYMERQRIEFYFIVPRQHLSFLREKITDVWTGVTIEEVDALPEFGVGATKLQLHYEKEDALSLATDRRNNDLLLSNLNVVELLEEGDKAAVFYNFLPGSQFSWRATYRHTIDKVNRHMPVDRNKAGLGYAAKMALSVANTLLSEMGEVFTGKKAKETRTNLLEGLIERLNGGKAISESTQRKAGATILNTEIVVLSESADGLRQRNAARSLAQSFDTISEDNRLAYKPYRRTFHFTDYTLHAERNKIGDQEAQNFIALPGREVLERFAGIERVETQETEVPEDLRHGVMCIGTNTYRGQEQKAYLSTDREYRNLTLVLIGPTRAGKSTLLGNLGADAIRNGECMIVFDFISNCQLSSEIAALFPPEKVLNIECGDLRKLQGLGYNEIGRSADPLRQYENAKMSATQLQTLVNAIATNDAPLTPKMKRYLQAAALVVFINGGAIRDVFEVLQDHEARAVAINAAPASQAELLRKHAASLAELDETDKKGVVTGTKDSLISGIIDRMNELEANTYLEMMLQKDTAGNIDLVKEIQKNQLICIRMPERAYPTDAEKDVICTYWMSKLRLALQIRDYQIPDRSKHTKVNMVIDELYQVRTTERMLKENLSRLAKFSLKPIISCHYLNQINIIRDELRSANASYMLISGCDKKNYAELQSELYPYQEEDLLNLPRYHSLNLIKNADGYARFITKLPKPVRNAT
ncbi:hypothetical protein [Paenibacillus sp.]|uniref:hypothetical protein n=1 Tax=Paenibacillus sp. TaxID=58172 RepID=UPI002D7041DD|nr:hypothetical protein [Paenibacillus sp.]HZG83813.1 hypothetical protein [Paenibacillus sp.]